MRQQPIENSGSFGYRGTQQGRDHRRALRDVVRDGAAGPARAEARRAAPVSSRTADLHRDLP